MDVTLCPALLGFVALSYAVAYLWTALYCAALCHVVLCYFSSNVLLGLRWLVGTLAWLAVLCVGEWVAGVVVVVPA